jgi:mutator protein MutT
MEYWDIYNKNRELTGRTVVRGDKIFPGDFHLVVFAIIINSKGECLISKRTPNKTFPNMWEITGGAAISGDTSKEAVLREIKEELGIDMPEESGEVVAQFINESNLPYFGDVWRFEYDIAIEKIKCQPEEVSEAKWVSKETLLALIEAGEFINNPFVVSAIMQFA